MDQRLPKKDIGLEITNGSLTESKSVCAEAEGIPPRLKPRRRDPFRLPDHLPDFFLFFSQRLEGLETPSILTCCVFC